VSSIGGFQNGCRWKFLCGRLSAQGSFPYPLSKQGDQGYPYIAMIPIPPLSPQRARNQPGGPAAARCPPPRTPASHRHQGFKYAGGAGFHPLGMLGTLFFPQREGEEKIDPTQRFPGVLFADLLVNSREEWESEEELPVSIFPEGHVWRVMSPTSVSMTAPLLHGNHFWG